ncbi:MAG TPA: DUF2723 domain-containing protein, partial [Thermoanaerobaculia bacterium]|nr:DUF2723 domain-containing protein [Thermoanaerobaculia bacterium]
MDAEGPARDRAVFFVLFAAVFAVYAVGACRTIYVGDSGELVTAVAVLGIPHPSGYPLYVLLGKLFCLLVPISSYAFRMSLFSAFFGALASSLLFLLARRARLSRPASVLSGLLLAFVPSFWAEANVQRVYTLNAFFVVVATFFAVKWHQERRDGFLLAAFFACGLGATNHTYMAVYAFGLGLFVLLSDLEAIRALGRAEGWIQWGKRFAAFFAGLLPYLYLPVRSRMNPPLDWGNPETLEAFWRVVSRHDFWDRRWIRGPVDLVPITADWLKGLFTESLGIGLLLAALGVVVAFRRKSPTLLFLLAMAGNLLSMALHGSRSDIFIWHRYYIPSFVMLALLAGYGADALIRRLPPAAGWGVLLVPAALLVTGWRPHDRSRYRIGEAFSEEVLRETPPGGHLIASDDNILFVLMYLHLAEGRRPDVD